jgi:hypothetical protein
VKMWAMLARGGRWLLVAILIAGTWIVLSAEESYACDCAAAEPMGALAQADSAFVGTLIERTEGGPSIPFYGDRVATFHFRVSDDLKGNLDDEIKVVTSAYGASCGLEVAEGARVGLFLTLARTASGPPACALRSSRTCCCGQPRRCADPTEPDSTDPDPTGSGRFG